MKVRLHDVDSTIPNLALMRLSAYWKGEGADVRFWRGEPADKLYVSTIFTRNRPDVETLQQMHPEAIIGGTGWDLSEVLPPEIEAMRPDYELYGIDYGLGFLWRGCVNRCGFCFVPKKEGSMQQVATLSDLINPRSDRLTLLDNNFLAAPNAMDIMIEIVERELEVDWCQGLDIRRVTPEVATALARIKFCTSSRRIHFAFDSVHDEAAVRRGVALLREAGIKPYRLVFYMLVGYDTSFEEDMYRFEVLRELGCDPYVMIYNDAGDSRLHHFDRWVNARIYKVCDWDHYLPWTRERDQIRFA